MKETTATYSFRTNIAAYSKFNKWNILWFIMLAIPFSIMLFSSGKYFSNHQNCSLYESKYDVLYSVERGIVYEFLEKFDKRWIFEEDKMKNDHAFVIFSPKKHDHFFIELFKTSLFVALFLMTIKLYFFVYKKVSQSD